MVKQVKKKSLREHSVLFQAENFSGVLSVPYPFLPPTQQAEDQFRLDVLSPPTQPWEPETYSWLSGKV